MTADEWREARKPEGKKYDLQRPCSRVKVRTAPDNEGSRLVPCGGFCGSLQQFGKGVLGGGIGWEDCGVHHYHWFPASKCEHELIGDAMGCIPP